MLRLMSIELQKLWFNKSSRILTIAYFALILSMVLIGTVEVDIFGSDKTLKFSDYGIYDFPFIWHFHTYIASILKIFLAIVIVTMVSNEYTYNTLKQNLIDGLSKKEFLMSKYLVVALFVVLSVLLVMILSLVLGFVYSNYTEIAIVFTDIDYLLAYAVKLCAFFSFCIFLGMLIKRSALALGFLALWNFVELIIMGIVKFSTLEDNKFFVFLTDYVLPLEGMSNLIPNPTMRLSMVRSATTQLGIEYQKDFSVNYLQILIVVLWTCIFVWATYSILKNRDL
ncbi:MAG: ABC transporter permease subunit [Bacteroidota bacterium]|nr:ABC transporter permease subunit [Bacteroidota bacterium]